MQKAARPEPCPPSVLNAPPGGTPAPLSQHVFPFVRFEELTVSRSGGARDFFHDAEEAACRMRLALARVAADDDMQLTSSSSMGMHVTADSLLTRMLPMVISGLSSPESLAVHDKQKPFQDEKNARRSSGILVFFNVPRRGFEDNVPY